MTTPSQPNVPLVQSVKDATTEETATVTKTTRFKALAKTTFTKVGVPVLIGTAAAMVATRRARQLEVLDARITEDPTE